MKQKTDKCAFLPHVGLGEGDLVRILMPELPIPLLLFDRVFVDKSVEYATDQCSDGIESKILEALSEYDVLELFPFTERSTLDNECYRIFNESTFEIQGKHIVSPKKQLDLEEFEKNIRKFPRQVQDALTPLKEACWSLQISKYYSLPFIQNNLLYLSLTDLILSFDNRRSGEMPKTGVYKSFKPVLEAYLPSVPLIVSDSGTPLPKFPIFFRQMEHFDWNIGGEPLPSASESRSLENLHMLMELRNSRNFKAFRVFLNEIAEKVLLNRGKEGFGEELKKNCTLGMSELQYSIVEECKWAEKFIKISAYISSPSGALTGGAFDGETAHEKIRKQKEVGEDFYKKNLGYSWRLFFSDPEKIYKKHNLLQKIMY